MAAEITVIVPIFNVGHFGVLAVQSLINQTFSDFEALLVDDGSTDGSGQAAFAAAAGDPRFRLIEQHNQGLSAARNRALDQAQGRLIAFLDGDDRFDPQFLERMRAALLADGGDWVACGLADCWPDDRCIPHSALYEQPMPNAPARWPLQSAGAILRHYPSAWNKLYRRSLIGDLRFDEGTWFEDHAFYQQLALRAGWILHLPEPLYLQTRGRDGQITASDDERIFHQFPVLDRLRAILTGAGLADATPAFAGFASRLLAERAPVLRNPDRRQRWLQAARDWLGPRGIRFQAEQSPSLARALSGGAAAGVVLDLTAGDALSPATLQALSSQDIAAFHLILVHTCGEPVPRALAALQRDCPDRPCVVAAVPPGTSRPGIWQAALEALPGPQAPEALVLAGPQDGFEPGALRIWADARGRSGADLAVSGCLTPAAAAWHDGWGDPAALSGPLQEGALLRPDPARLPFLPLPCAQLIGCDMLAAVLPAAHNSPWPEAALAEALARAGATAVWLNFPGARPGLQPGPRRAADLFAYARSLAAQPGDEARGLARQAVLRGLQMQREFATPPGRGARITAVLRLLSGLIRAGLTGRLTGPGPLDPRLSAPLKSAAIRLQ